MDCAAGRTRVEVPFADAASKRNPEMSMGVGPRFRNSTYWVSEDPEFDHMTSLITTEAEILTYEAADCAFKRASLTFAGAALTEVVP